MKNLHLELKTLIIETLNLEEITPDAIDSEAPLFGDGLGLDSIDALELGLAVKRQYGITLSDDSTLMREYFFSVANLAKFITSQTAVQ